MCQFLAFLTLFETSSGISDFRSIHNSSVHPFIILFDSGQKQGTRTGLIWELNRKFLTRSILNSFSHPFIVLFDYVQWPPMADQGASTGSDSLFSAHPIDHPHPSLPSHTWLSSWSSSKSLVSYPTRCNLLFIIGFLYGSSISSSSKQQRNIVQLCTTKSSDSLFSAHPIDHSLPHPSSEQG